MTAITTTVTTAATTQTASEGRALGALYAIQAAQTLLPLLSVPFLARTLGPEAWGRAAAAQGFVMLAGLVIEYGFNLSGARSIAQARGDQTRLRRIFAGLLTAQFSLWILVVALTLAARPWIALFQEDAWLLGAALLWMTPQVISLQWYFQGVEQMPRLSAHILTGRLTGLLGVFCLVRGPADAALSLFLPGLCGVGALVAAAWEPCVTLRPSLASWPETRRVLREGAALCLYRAGIAGQGAGNVFVLAVMLNPVAAGTYAGAERLVRAALGFLEPLLVTAFPRMAYLRAQRHNGEAAAWDRLSVSRIAAAGLLLAAGLWIAGPSLVRLLLGDAYREAGELMPSLAFWPLANALGQLRGLNGLAASGRDRLLTAAVLAAGVTQMAGLVSICALDAGAVLHYVALWMVVAQFLYWIWLEWLTRAQR